MSLEFISVAYVTQKTVHKLHQTILLFHPLLNRWCRRLQKTKSVKVKKHDVILEIVSERLPWTLEISSIGFERVRYLSFSKIIDIYINDIILY